MRSTALIASQVAGKERGGGGRSVGAMRDLVIREGLGTMARDAAKLFRELIAAGEEIPYEVSEPGEGSPLCRYRPLTERFIRDHAGALRELDSFGAACAALEASELTGPYLEQLGVAAPEQPRARAELAGIVFLCRLWMDSTDLALDRERLTAAIEELEAGCEGSENEVEVIVPLRGLQMPLARLELAGATIVRADTVEVPPEARAGDVIGASPWEPTFLAVARVEAPSDSESQGGAAAPAGTDAFRRLITTLRLFKPGGVGLGPHAWVATASNRWRRISTGAGRARPGGYRLGEAELGELVALSRALASTDTPLGRLEAGRGAAATALGRAISRFEAGLERTVVLEALSDNLLALRILLEGGGPADLGLAMRVAALCAEPGGRGEVKSAIERAQALERELWSGEPQGGGPIPAETAIRLEELTRAILRDAACGHLGSDLRATADEILLADGLAVGDGAGEQLGETAEWEAPEPDEAPGAPDGAGEPLSAADPYAAVEPVVQVDAVERRISAQVTEKPSDFEEEQMTLQAQIDGRPARPAPAPTPVEPRAPEPGAEEPSSPVLRLIEQSRNERRERAERVANLFPRAETEWNVRELGYERRRRAASRAS